MASASVAARSVSVTMTTMQVLFNVIVRVSVLLQLTSAQFDGLAVPDLVAYTGKVFAVSFTSHPVYGDLDINVQISQSVPTDASRNSSSWLIFNTTTRSLSGVPLLEDQGWMYLTITTECIKVNTSIRNNNVCQKSAQVFRVGVLPFSWTDFLLTSAGLSTLSASDTSSTIDDTISADNICEEDKIISSLVLCVSLEKTTSVERLEIVTHLSEFLSIPISSFILESSPSHSLTAIKHGFHIFYAGPGSGESCNLKENTEIIWSLPCVTVTHLNDFVRVLQHNVDGGRFQKEINTDVVGWYVASSNSQLTKRVRRRRRNISHTAIHTPVITQLKPTAVVISDDDEDTFVISGDVEESIQINIPHPIGPNADQTVIFTQASSPGLFVTSSFEPPFSKQIQQNIQLSSPLADFSSIALDQHSTYTPSVLQLASETSEFMQPEYKTTSAEYELVSKFSISAEGESQAVDTLSLMLPSHDEVTSDILDHSLLFNLLSADSRSISSSSSSSSPVLSTSVLLPDSVYMVTSRAVEVVAFSHSTIEQIGLEESQHSLYPSTTLETSDISLFVHEPTGHLTPYYSEQATFGIKHSELLVSSMYMSIPTLDQKLLSFATLSGVDSSFPFMTSLFPTTSLAYEKAPYSYKVVDNVSSTDDDLSMELTTSLIIEFSDTTESLLEGDHLTTGQLVLDDTTEAIQPTLPTRADIVTSVWTTTMSSIPADMETTIETEIENISNGTLYLRNPIGVIVGELGKMLELNVSQVFSNVLNGNSSLTLSLELPSNQETPENFWLYLDSEAQILTGLPLPEDLVFKNFSLLLVARHSTGQTAVDTISVKISNTSTAPLTHIFIMKFGLDYQKFMLNRKNLTDLITAIGNYFDSNGSKFMTVLKVEQGSLRITWTNNTLTGTVCPKDDIRNLLNQVFRSGGIVKSAFNRHIEPENQLIDVLFEPQGACFTPTTTTSATTTTYLVSDAKRGYNLIIWAHVILPVMIACLVFVLIILIIVFCNRRRRHREAVLNAEKEAVSNDRNPIIFPDELEVDDPSLKAKDPLVLPTDSKVSNQNVDLDSSPTKGDKNQDKVRHRDHEQRKKDRERAKSQSEGEEDWRRKNRQANGVNHEDEDPKQKNDNKLPKTHSKISRANTISSLPRDRPSNHFLEEESGSRSNTLKATKSLHAEKRHPKSPPPYWQSQTDPPPYRLPPPYLTDITQV